jgi:diguanylate cyclase (GGDEF)-like protein
LPRSGDLTLEVLRDSLDKGRRLLPAGRLLPNDVWQSRHRIVLAVLWAHVPAVLLFGLLVGEPLGASLAEAWIVAAMALVATPVRFGRSVRSVAACVGLVTSSAILVHLSGGYIELHFHFFVMVALMAIYQEWIPFLVAIAYVVFHHAVLGVIAPEAVFNHPAGHGDPVFWALVHGGFIVGLSAVCLVSWSYSQRAVIDTLTGLVNRTLLTQRLSGFLSDKVRAGSVAVLYIDLDDFKHVNDSLGHGGGDETLNAIAGRLVQLVSRTTTVARMGGDEFAILLSASSVRAAEELGRRIVEALEVPIKIGSTEVYQRASIGIALNSRSAHDADTLLRNADMAMYDAKSAGKAQVRFFRPELHSAHLRRLEFEGEIRRGLEAEEFVLHYQPILDVGTGSVVAFEALMRWQHPARGMLQPAEFIPLAEETGLIAALGRWGVRTACLQLRQWQEADGWPSRIDMAVNVSTRELKSNEFVDSIADALSNAGLAAHSLVLEVTETVLLSEPEVASERLRALKETGVRIAIDDFGSGYSSLSYLTRLPVDVLKIDRALTATVADGVAGSAVMEAALALGRHLGIQTIAEGVEDDAQLDQLRTMGCGLVQGFLFAAAMEPDDARRFALARPGDHGYVHTGRRRASRAPRAVQALT